jgi:hypothetical protein
MNAYITNLFTDSTESESTIKNRIRFLMSLANLFDDAKDLSFLNDTKTVLARVNDTNNVGTRHTRMGTIMKVLNPNTITKKAFNQYEKLYTELGIQKNANRDNNVMTDKQKENQFSIDELEVLLDQRLKDIYDKYKMASFPSNVNLTRLYNDGNLFNFGSDYQKFISMAVYVYQPAIRNNYADMRWTTTKKNANDPTQNYYWKKPSGSKLIMRRYKNDYSLGEQYISVRPKLNQYMKNWYTLLAKMIGSNPINVLNYSITSKTIKHNPNTESFKKQLPRTFNELTGLHITINSLRHAWEDKIQSDPKYNKLTVGEKEQLHLELLHRFDTAQRYQLLDRD